MNKQKNNRTLLLALLLALSLMLSACGGGTDDGGSDVPDDDGLGGGTEMNNGGSEDAANGDFSVYEGIWLAEANNEYDYLEIAADGSWSLYIGNDVIADGYLQYEPEWESIYAYNDQDGSGGRFALEDGGRLYISTYGYFNFADGMEYLWFDENGSGNTDGYTEDDANGTGGTDGGYSNYDSYDISSLAGIWYYDGDLASDIFIVVDDNGGWSLYQRAPGAENAEVDSGWISDAGEANTFYADSAVYDGVSYRMYVFETDVMMWGGEDDYYERME